MRRSAPPTVSISIAATYDYGSLSRPCALQPAPPDGWVVPVQEPLGCATTYTEPG